MNPIKLIDLATADTLREACATATGELDISDANDKDKLNALILRVRQKLQSACDAFTESVNRKVDASMIMQADQECGHTLFGTKISISIEDDRSHGKVPLKLKKLHPEAKLPAYAHEGDAGMDVFALEDTTIHRGQPTMVKTGLAAEIPPGYEIQVRPRSGLALKGVTVWNSPGTIDSKYRGEIGIILMFNTNELETILDVTGTVAHHEPKRSYEIKKGDKIAQLVLAPVTFADVSETKELSETDRGTGGFGSTGR